MHARAEPQFEWLEGSRALDWNGPVERPFERFRDTGLNRPIIEHLQRVAAQHRTRIAIRDADTVITFGRLWDGLSGLAESIASRTKAAELVGILLPAEPLFPLAILASLAAGRPFVVLDPHWPADWLQHVLRDARPGVVITSDYGPAGLPVPEIRLTQLPRAAGRGWRPASLAVDEPACVLFTSGSTGRPKSIVNSQRNLLQRVAQATHAAHFNSADRFLTLASPCTIVAVRDVFTALLAGASIHLLDPQGVGAREILNVIREEATTVLFAFPALLRSVVAARRGQMEALRLVRVGGDTTLWSDFRLLREWLPAGAAIQVVYAATEAPMMHWFVDEACRSEDPRVPIGYPLPGNRLALIDELGNATPPGEIGELVVASPYVSLGQWTGGRCDAANVESVGRGVRLFRSGDLVRQRSDGLLERVGRKDRQVKVRGTRVDLEGIEAVLRGHPRVHDIAALARTHATDGSVSIVAYVQPREGDPAAIIEELKTYMRSEPPPMRPARFYLAPRIPRLASGKLDPRALAALDAENLRDERAEPAAAAAFAPADDDPIAQTVARLWMELLQSPLRGPEDDFFDSGGDSLRAMTFLTALERSLGLELSLTLINEAPRFGQLCEALRERRAPASLLVTLKPGDRSPPLFFIHGVGGNVVEMLPTARRVGIPGAVIGIRARGVAPGETPHRTVEAMAADYLQEIRARQPRGPYHLCGYSFGGLVAFEIARRLRDADQPVGFVGLFDTLMSPVRWPPRVWGSVIRWHLGRLPGLLRAPRKRAPRDPSFPEPPLAIRTRAATLYASARFRPGFYDGTLTLFAPAERAPGLPAPDAIWRAHAGALEVIELAGTHENMLSGRNAAATAAALTRGLRQPD